MASLHELRELPLEGDFFLSFDDLLEVICDASVRHKFSIKNSYKDKKRARYLCANAACPWKHIPVLHAGGGDTSLQRVRGHIIRGGGDSEVDRR